MITCVELCPVHEQNICCFLCAERATCKDACDQAGPEECEGAVNTGAELTAVEKQVQPILQTIKNLVIQKKAIEAEETKMRDKLKEAMETYGVKSFDNELIKVTYIPATTSTGLDSAKVKKLYPQIVAECSKVTKKSAYIKIEVKE